MGYSKRWVVGVEGREGGVAVEGGGSWGDAGRGVVEMGAWRERL